MSRYPDDYQSRRRSHADDGPRSHRSAPRRRDGYDASDEEDLRPRRSDRGSGAARSTRSKPPPESRRHASGDLPRRSKSHHESDRYDRGEPKPRRPDPTRDSSDRHRRRKSLHAGDDTEGEQERPRRRRPAERSSRHQDDGYGTERAHRRSRDDDHHERGYRTDGRDPRRERRQAEDRPHRSSRDQGRPRDSRDRPAKGGGMKIPNVNMNEVMEKGQKGWKTVEPVAKPLLAQLAKQYLAKGGG